MREDGGKIQLERFAATCHVYEAVTGAMDRGLSLLRGRAKRLSIESSGLPPPK